MSLIATVLAGVLSTLGSATAIYLARGALGRLRARRAARQATPAAPVGSLRRVRHYTLLRTIAPDGNPARYTTTRPVGSIITHPIDGRPRDFELTDLPLGDGTFAAEPL